MEGPPANQLWSLPSGPRGIEPENVAYPPRRTRNAQQIPFGFPARPLDWGVSRRNEPSEGPKWRRSRCTEAPSVPGRRWSAGRVAIEGRTRSADPESIDGAVSKEGSRIGGKADPAPVSKPSCPTGDPRSPAGQGSNEGSLLEERLWTGAFSPCSPEPKNFSFPSHRILSDRRDPTLGLVVCHPPPPR
jgi:hypothetical protein